MIVHDYGMYGRLNDDVVDEIFKIEPGVKKALQKRTEYYGDPLQIFLAAAIQRIDFLKKAPT